MGAATHFTDAGTRMTDAVSQVGTAYRGMGAGGWDTLKNVGNTAESTLTDVPRAVGTKIKSLPGNIINMPVAPGLSVPEIAKIVQKGSPDEMNTAIEKIVGIKARDILDFPQGTSRPNIQKRIDDYMGAIKRQILSEIKLCIERWLQHIANEIPIVGILLDLEGYIERRISKYRLELQRKIRSEIEKLAHEKLKLWQSNMLRQKILEYVRKVCPDTHRLGSSSGHWKNLSPTLIHRLQTDETWKIVDGETDVETLLDTHSPSSIAWSNSEHNTARLVDGLVNDAVAAVQTDAVIQSGGFNNASWDDFIDDDGEVRTSYTNSDGDTVDQIEVKKLITCKD